MKDYVMVNGMDNLVVSKVVVCSQTYFICKNNNVMIWCYHKDDLPSKYKELVRNLK